VTESATPEQAVADTSYLLPFGLAARHVLQALHPHGVECPSSVRAELAGLARVKDAVRSGAAKALASPRRNPIRYVDVPAEHEGLRERILDDLHAEDVRRGKATGDRAPSSTRNRGEADCMCLCAGRTEPLRCNDSGARAVAHRRGLRTQTTAADLRRLLDRGFTAVQLAQIARRMQPLDIGETVDGPAYFRRPQRD
jgi:hypothetical protein